MTVIPITCDNCGAKYKLPPTFRGAQAKCQKCGSVIDIAKQRDAAGSGASEGEAAKPASSRPAAAAKPAIDRSKSRPGTRKTAAAAASDKADRPGRGASSRARRSSRDDAEEGSPRRGRAVQKNNNMPMILGGVGLVVIIIAITMMMMGGDDKNTEATAQTNNEAGKAAIKDAAKTAPANDTAKDAPPAEPAPVVDVKAQDAANAKPKPKADPTPPEPADAGKPKRKLERWEKQKNPAQTMGDVKSAAELYGEVQWSESIDAAAKAEILSITEDLDEGGGIRSIRAKNKLIKKGYAGMFGILEHLRTLDYRQTDDAAFGFELNKALEDITGGFWNAKYEPVQAGETMHPAKAQWNTKNVKAWMGLLATWPDEDAFKKAKRKRAKKED